MMTGCKNAGMGMGGIGNTENHSRTSLVRPLVTELVRSGSQLETGPCGFPGRPSGRPIKRGCRCPGGALRRDVEGISRIRGKCDIAGTSF